MRSKEFTEAEHGTNNARKIESMFRNAGYNKIGTGTSATVWAKAGTGRAIKILMPGKNMNRSSAVRAFMKFFEYCQAHQNNKHLPKFFPLINNQYVNAFVVDGVRYYQAAMECLNDLDNPTDMAMVWGLGTMAARYETFDDAIYELTLPQAWEDYFKSAHVTTSQLANLVHNLSKSKLVEYESLYKTMLPLHRTGSINKLSWDMHQYNVMKRSDGTMVVIDPWFEIGLPEADTVPGSPQEQPQDWD